MYMTYQAVKKAAQSETPVYTKQLRELMEGKPGAEEFSRKLDRIDVFAEEGKVSVLGFSLLAAFMVDVGGSLDEEEQAYVVSQLREVVREVLPARKSTVARM